ncbi:MAG: RNA polymerase sigma factor [Candidatus Saccharicenans sp.]|uniref:RNA polymerase sigma factor n=1 Tax=Candidatus Saccharicenans sp. TaxID=2819258 RepID=UPI00404986A7
MDEREKELVRKALSGESAAFEELVLPFRQSLLHLAYRMTGNMEEAMDIAQETFLRCYRYLNRFDQDRNFRNWLFQIAANLARDYHRNRKMLINLEKGWQKNRRGGDNPYSDASIEIASSQSSVETSSDLHLDINACLGNLSPKERQVFVLRDLEGLSIKETAAVLKTSSISVRVNLSSARRKIREFISGQKATGRPEGKNEM